MEEPSPMLSQVAKQGKPWQSMAETRQNCVSTFPIASPPPQLSSLAVQMMHYSYGE